MRLTIESDISGVSFQKSAGIENASRIKTAWLRGRLPSGTTGNIRIDHENSAAAAAELICDIEVEKCLGEAVEQVFEEEHPMKFFTAVATCALLIGAIPQARAEVRDFGARDPEKVTGTVGGEKHITVQQEADLRKKLPLPTEPGGVKTGVVHTRCLARWDDSHQLHSTELVVQPGYQAWKKTMKKLEHCIRLDLEGVTSIDGVADEYVRQCIDYGLNDQKTRHALELVVAIYADHASEGKTDFTALKIADYVRSAANATVDCLLDTDRITKFLGEKLKERFNASVRTETQWIYWEP